MLFSIMLIASLTFYLYVILFFYFSWKRGCTKFQETTTSNHYYSVVVPVRNEERNIEKLLNALSRQQFPLTQFEVIVVNDHSEDRTMELVSLFKKNNPAIAISLLELPTELASKKSAITYAVEKSKGDWIITTDADCWMNDKWLITISNAIQTNTSKMIVGPVAINETNTFFNKFQVLDYLAMQVIGLSSLCSGKPLLCSGANLAFEKASFMEVNGYEGNEHNPSGDDTFLMFKMEKEYPGKISALLSKEAVTFTEQALSISDFFQQRIRWASKVKMYKNGYVFCVGVIIGMANAGIVAGYLFCFFSPDFFTKQLLFISIKSLLDWSIISEGRRFFSFKFSYLDFIKCSLLYSFVFTFSTILAIRGKFTWKERNYQL